MGGATSSSEEPDGDALFLTPMAIGLLAQFSGESHIAVADGLWSAIFAFLEQSPPLQSYSAVALEALTRKCCCRLARHNPTTQNFVAFLSHLVERINAFPAVQPRGVLSGLVLARLCLHAMMAECSASGDPVRRLAVQIGFNPHALEGAAPGDGGEMATAFCEALTAQLRASDNAPSGDASGGASRSMMRLETINMVLVLLSLPLYAGAQAPSPFLDLFLCADSALSARLVRGLLEIVTERSAAQSAREREAEAEANSRPSLLWRLGGAVGGAMLSVATLPLVLYSALVGGGALSAKRELESFEVATDPLALRALLLVLLLGEYSIFNIQYCAARVHIDVMCMLQRLHCLQDYLEVLVLLTFHANPQLTI